MSQQSNNIFDFFKLLEMIKKPNYDLKIYIVKTEDQELSVYFTLVNKYEKPLRYENAEDLELLIESREIESYLLTGFSKAEVKEVIQLATEKFLIRNSVDPASVLKKHICLHGSYDSSSEINIFYDQKTFSATENNALRERRMALLLDYPRSTRTSEILLKLQEMSIEDLINRTKEIGEPIRTLKSPVN